MVVSVQFVKLVDNPKQLKYFMFAYRNFTVVSNNNTYCYAQFLEPIYTHTQTLNNTVYCIIFLEKYYYYSLFSNIIFYLGKSLYFKKKQQMFCCSEIDIS